MKTTARVGLVLILVGLIVVLSFPGLTGADSGGANIIRGNECTISLVGVGGNDVIATDTQSVETPNGNVSLVCRADLPDGLDPPRRTVRTSGELCETSLGPTTNTVKVITPSGKVRLTCRVNGKAQETAGWAVGNSISDGYGVIIHTTDGGQGWVRQGKAGEIPDVDLQTVSAIDAQNAWVVGAQGTILRTHNGGRTWQRQEIPAEVSGADLWGVYAVDRRTAWVTGSSGTLLHTIDGGRSWTQQGQDTVPKTSDLKGVYASDADNAWAISTFPTPSVILRTTDGGANWYTVPYTGSSPGWLIWTHGIDADTVWVSGTGAVWHTANGGQTWVDQTPPGMGDFNGVFAVDRNTIWTALDPAMIFHSGDGGTTWEKQFNLQPQRMIRVSAVDPQTAWTVSVPHYSTDSGCVLSTKDGGQTWRIQTTPVQTGWWGVSFVR